MAFLQRLFINLQSLDEDTKEEKCSSNFSTCYIIKANDIDPEDKSDSNYFFKNDPPNTLYCAKVSKQILTKASEQEKLIQEVLILRNVSHPSILPFRGFNLYDFERTPHPTILTLFMENGSLHRVIEGDLQLDETKKQICIIGVASAMYHLHHKDIAHLNLQPSNVLLDNNYYPKVCDFGLNRKYSKNNYKVNIAPELVDKDPADFDPKELKRCDVFSFGILCYEIITGKIPFDKLDSSTVYQKVKQGAALSFTGVNISESFVKLINDCYQADPAKRPDFQHIYSSLIDDCSLNINDQVNIQDISNYIKSLGENITESGKVKLQICKNEGTVLEYVEQKKQELKESPETLYEIINTKYEKATDKASQMAYILKMYSHVINDPSIFAKATVYANDLAFTNDKSAKAFLKKAFGDQIIDSETITSHETKSCKRSDKGLFNINISTKVKTIGAKAFQGNENLQYINLLPTLENIKNEAFKGCKKLTFVNLNNKMTTIEDSTFEKCRDLAYVRLPDNLTHIGDSAFKDCTSLESIYIPPSVKSIRPNAFKGCKNLVKVEMSSKTKYDEKRTFPAKLGRPRFYD